MSELENLIEDVEHKLESVSEEEQAISQEATAASVETFIQYDSVNPAEIPADANIATVGVAGYVGGIWPDYSEIVAKFPKARHKSVAVNATEDADVLDIEKGDATPAEAPAWVKKQIARGVKKPGVYADASTMPEVLKALEAGGLARSEYVVWIAHYVNAAPAYPFEQGADAIQWTQAAEGKDLDQSIAIDNFWDITQPSPPVKNPTHYDWFDDTEIEYKGAKITERGSVQNYDKYRAKPSIYGEQLKVYEPRLHWLANRVYNNAHNGVKPGQTPHWGQFHRGWRFQQLIHRAQGTRFV